MSQQLGANANDLTITIPSSGERDWATSIRDNCFQKISDHTHEGSGLGKKLRGYLALDNTEALVANNTTIKSRNAAGTGTTDILKIDANDELVISSTIASIELQDDGLTIVDNADNTKKIAFDASAITTATTRTITMIDADVDLAALTNANISASAAIALSKLAATTASRALVSDGSGLISASAVTATELGYVSGVTSAIQTQIDALPDSGTTDEITITGTAIGLADNPILPSTGSVTIPKGTTAQRSGSPASGMLRFNTEISQFEGYNGSAWGQIGGGGGGLDSVNTQDFQSSVDAASVSTGNNATFGGGGTIDGAVSDETSSPISGDQSLKYTAGSASTNDYVSIETITLDAKQKGEFVGVTLYADMTNFSANVDFVVKTDEGDILTFTNTDILVGGKAKSRYAFNVFIPSTASSLTYGIHMVNAPVNTESLLIDDIEFTLNPFVYKNLTERNTVSLEGNSGEVITASTENIVFNGSGTGWDGTNYEYTTQKGTSLLNINGSVSSTTNIKKLELYKNGTLFKSLNGVNEGSFGIGQFSITLVGGTDYSIGDIFSIRTTSGFTLDSVSTEHYLTIIEEWQAEHVITPAKSESNHVRLEDNGAEAITANTENIVFNGSGTGWDAVNYEYDVQQNDSTIFLSFSIRASANARYILYKNGSAFKEASYDSTTANLRQGTIVLPKGSTVKGDALSLRCTTGITLVSSTEGHYLDIVEAYGTVSFLAAIPTNVQNNATDYVTVSGITIEGTTTNPTKPTTMDKDEIIWARAGQNLKATYKYYAASTTGAAAGSGDYLFTLPNGLSFDSNVVDFYSTVEGSGAWQLDGQMIGKGGYATGSGNGDLIIVPYDATRFRLMGTDQAGAGVIGSGFGGVTTCESYYFQIDAPIAGWTSAGTFLSATPVNKTAYIKDVKAANTAGGTFTSGAWRTRDLNTVEGDTDIVSLSSNQFTLGAGKYEIESDSPAYFANVHKLKLYNVTDASDAIIGQNAMSVNGPTYGTTTHATLKGTIEISSTKTFEIQHRCTLSGSFGYAANMGVDEVYTVVKITKIPSA